MNPESHDQGNGAANHADLTGGRDVEMKMRFFYLRLSPHPLQVMPVRRPHPV
jgi:hypothetical protein